MRSFTKRLAAIAAVSVILLTGCASNSPSGGSTGDSVESADWTGSTELKSMKIGLLQMFGSSENQQHWQAVAERGLKAIGAEYTVIDGKGDTAVQAQGLASFVQQDVDAVFAIGGITVETMIPQLEQARAAGIPVISAGVQSSDNQGFITAQFAPDDGEFGTVLGDYLVDKLPAGAPWGAFLLTAFAGGNAPNLTVLPILEDAGHERVATIDLDISGDVSTQVTKGAVDMLSANPDIKLLFGCCDFTAGFTAPALKQAGYPDVIQAVRYDNLSTLDLIKQGYPVVVAAVNEDTAILAGVGELADFVSTGREIDAATMDGRYEFAVVDETNLPAEGKFYFDQDEQFDEWLTSMQSKFKR